MSKVRIFQIAFCLLTWVKPIAVLGADDKGDKPKFIYISHEIPVELSNELAICVTSNGNEIPAADNFAKIENTFSALYQKANFTNNWLKIILKNNVDSVVKVVFRFDRLPSNLHLYYSNEHNIKIRKQTGILVKSTDKLPINFYGCIAELQPGTDTIYIYNADTWKKFSYGSIAIINQLNFETSTELLSKINPDRGLDFALFAFNMLLLFQLFYVIVQAYFHRKPVYREYFFYLFTLLVYFLIRYELCFGYTIITFGEPSIRPLLNDMMLILPFAFYLRFSRYFIEMPFKYSQMNNRIRVVEMAIFILIFIYIIMFFTQASKFGVAFLQVVTIILSIYSLKLIYFFYKQRDKQIRFLLAGSLAAASGHFIATLFSASPELHNMLAMQPIYVTMIGLSFEIFFFNTGLGYKAMNEQNEKVKAQAQLISQLNENRKIHNRLEGMRNKIAADLHDDVGSTLSSIGLYSEIGLTQLEKNPDNTKEILNKISDSSQRLMTAMNDIVWAIHSRKNDGENLFDRIKQYTNERLGSIPIVFKLLYTEEVANLIFSMEARRNILLICKEAINNAVKYSKTNEIYCEFTIDASILVIKIIDKGIGLNVNSSDKGYGILSMKNRVNEMNGDFELISSNSTGTTVLVKLPLEEIVTGDLNL